MSPTSTCEKDKLWRDSNPFSQPPGGEKGVPGVLHQPKHQAYKGGLKLGLTRPITASTVAFSFSHRSVWRRGKSYAAVNSQTRRLGLKRTKRVRVVGVLSIQIEIY